MQSLDPAMLEIMRKRAARKVQAMSAAAQAGGQGSTKQSGPTHSSIADTSGRSSTEQGGEDIALTRDSAAEETRGTSFADGSNEGQGGIAGSGTNGSRGKYKMPKFVEEGLKVCLSLLNSCVPVCM